MNPVEARILERIGVDPSTGSIGFQLPKIAGKWFYVDGENGVAGNDGSVGSPALTLKAAYDLCTDGDGDGICILGMTDSSTTYSVRINAPFTWSKWGITVFGVAAGGFNSRARVSGHTALSSAASLTMVATVETITRSTGSFITDGWKVGMTGVFDTSGANSNKTFTVTAVTALVMTGTVGTDTLASDGPTTHTLCGYFPYLIDISGQNNRFFNLSFINAASHVLNVGAVSVSGARNLFSNCHFSSENALASATATGLYDVRVSASEIQFFGCYFGNNSILRASACGNILLGLSTTAIGQVFFTDCTILSTSATIGHGGVNLADAATLGGWVVFKRCTFINWASGALTALTTLVIGATQNNCGLLFQDCGIVGWAAITLTAVHKVFTTNATGAAGIGGVGNTLT